MALLEKLTPRYYWISMQIGLIAVVLIVAASQVTDPSTAAMKEQLKFHKTNHAEILEALDTKDWSGVEAARAALTIPAKLLVVATCVLSAS